MALFEFYKDWITKDELLAIGFVDKEDATIDDDMYTRAIIYGAFTLDKNVTGSRLKKKILNGGEYTFENTPNLTNYEKQEIRNCVALLAKQVLTYGADDFLRGSSSISMGNVSVNQTEPNDPFYIPPFVYDTMLDLGLFVELQTQNIRPKYNNCVDTPFIENDNRDSMLNAVSFDWAKRNLIAKNELISDYPVYFKVNENNNGMGYGNMRIGLVEDFISKIKGPKGDKGDKGDAGPIGPQGIPGKIQSLIVNRLDNNGFAILWNPDKTEGYIISQPTFALGDQSSGAGPVNIGMVRFFKNKQPNEIDNTDLFSAQLNDERYLKKIDLSDYVKKSDLPNFSKFIKRNDIIINPLSNGFFIRTLGEHEPIEILSSPTFNRKPTSKNIELRETKFYSDPLTTPINPEDDSILSGFNADNRYVKKTDLENLMKQFLEAYLNKNNKNKEKI